MAKAKKHQRLFSGMGYREVQKSNASRRSKLPKAKQQELKKQGYKNVGWEHVINLYQAINAVEAELDLPEDSLEQLFIKADRIGNKYQTQEERSTFRQQLTTEVTKVANIIDKQFPETGRDSIDFSSQTQR